MIIEAGYDLAQLLHPAVHADAASRRALWILCADKDLRLLQIDPVCEVYSGRPESHVAEILAALAGCYRPARYFALGHTMSPSDGDEDGQQIFRGDEALRDAHEFESGQFLGRLVFDGDWVQSSAPRYSFRDYPGHGDLPRAAVIAGPHPGDCSCLACSQFNEMMAQYRALREQEEDSGDSGEPAESGEPGELGDGAGEAETDWRSESGPGAGSQWRPES